MSSSSGVDHLFETHHSPRRVASSNKPTSTSDRGSITYRTTLPRMNMFFTDDRWGYLFRSNTSTSSSLMLRYWSTDFRLPRIRMSFLSSMVTVWLVSVLKKLYKPLVSVQLVVF